MGANTTNVLTSITRSLEQRHSEHNLHDFEFNYETEIFFIARLPLNTLFHVFYTEKKSFTAEPPVLRLNASRATNEIFYNFRNHFLLFLLLSSCVDLLEAADV